MNKAALRKSYLQKRLSLQEHEYEKACSDIYVQFFKNINLTSIRVVHSFLPMYSKKEPDTARILQKMMHTMPSVRIAVPKINTTNNILESVYYVGQSLSTTKWNVAEPKHGEATCHEDIDLVIVPLLAFDIKGHRVGYGKGYYDRFLATCRPDCQKMGLSFFPPVDHILANRWDVSLNTCITSEKMYRFV